MKKGLSRLLIALILITSIPFAPVHAEVTNDLIISEYVEKGNDKAIEIYNGTGAPVDLSQYTLINNTNGKTDAGSFKEISLAKDKNDKDIILANDSVIVITYSQAAEDIKSKASIISGTLQFNGDDPVILMKGDVEIDHIGVPGKVKFAEDITLVRKPEILVGLTGDQDVKNNGEWIEYPKGDYLHLGQHSSVANLKVQPVTSNAASGSVVEADTVIELSTVTEGATIQVAMHNGSDYDAYTDYAPITVTDDIQFKAKATKSGLADSDVTEFTYTVQATPVTKVQAAKDAYVDEVDPKYIDDNDPVKLQVTVTGKARDYFLAQDDTAGIGIKLPSGASLNIGDEITVKGRLGQYYSFGYIKVESPADIKVLSEDNTVEPVEITVDQLDESVEGKLVKLINTEIGAHESGDKRYGIANESNKAVGYGDASWLTTGETYESITGSVGYIYKKYTVYPESELNVVEDSSAVRDIKSDVDSGLIDKDTSVTLSTLTDDAKIYYTTNGDTPDENSTLYENPINVTETLVIKAVAIKDGLSNSDILTLNLEVIEEAGNVTISQIQGESHTSPYKNKQVTDVVGTVTALLDYEFDWSAGKNIVGFYMQADTDNNDATSDAIFVSSKETVKIGDSVKVSGLVVEQVKESEFYAYSQENQLSVTTINASSVSVESSDNALPEATVIGTGHRQVPHGTASKNFSEYDIDKYAIDFYESMECMLVTVNDPVIVGPHVNRVVTIVPDNMATAKSDNDVSIHGGIVLQEDDHNTERLPLNTAILKNGLNTVKTAVMGDKISDPVKGILEYEWTAYQIYVTEDVPALDNPKTIDDVFKYQTSNDELTIASYNVYNHGGDDKQSKTDGIANQIVHNMKTPDIIGLVEVQDNDGKNNSSVVDASETYQLFIDAIIAKGGPTYEWTDISPVDDQEGGEPGGNIRVGFLYNPARVSLKEGTKGGSSETVTVDAEGHLTKNPGRIAATEEAFDNTRKSLAAEFEFNGENIIVIANHLKSKGGDDGEFGNVQHPIKHSEAKRLEQAKLVNEFIDSVLAANPDANIVTLGDMNDFHFSSPVKALAGDVLTNMIDTLPLEEQFTYMHGGNSQVLDHILVSNNLASDTKVDVVNINSTLAKEVRHSDHDAVIVAISGLGADTYVAPVTSSKDQTAFIGQTVELSTTSSNATIYYSLGDLDLDTITNNTEYTTPISVTDSMTIKAVAKKGDYLSEVKTYTITASVAPALASASGSVEKDTKVTLTSETPEAKIYYTKSDTLDLDTITNNTEYTEAITIDENMTIKTVAVLGDKVSEVKTYNYIVISNEAITVAEAKALPKGTPVILDVIVTSTPGAFGNKSIVFQDTTGGGYIYTKSLPEGITKGTHVKITGETSDYSGQFQMAKAKYEILEDLPMPEAKVITIDQVGEENEALLVKLENLRIGEITTDKYKSTYIDAVKDGKILKIKLDNRSGKKYDDAIKVLDNDNIIDIQGYLIEKNDEFTLNLNTLEDITVKKEGTKLINLQTTDLSYSQMQNFAQNEFVNVEVRTSSDLDEIIGTVLFKVTKDDKPMRLGFSSFVKSDGDHAGFGFDTTGLESGTYKVTAYYWASLMDPTVLSSEKSVEFVIE